MSRRLEFHSILVKTLGSENVYFQPPSSVKMNYPCIIYERNEASPEHADDMLYHRTQGYMITVVDPNPDSEIPGKVAMLPLARFDRFFTVDNLNHDIYTIFY